MIVIVDRLLQEAQQAIEEQEQPYRLTKIDQDYRVSVVDACIDAAKGVKKCPNCEALVVDLFMDYWIICDARQFSGSEPEEGQVHQDLPSAARSQARACEPGEYEVACVLVIGTVRQ